jgi:hypothetical protein
MEQHHSGSGDNIAGDKIIKHYQETPIPHALTSAPFKSPIFLGREKDLEAIKKKLFAGALITNNL